MAKRNEQDSAPKGDVQDEGAQDSAPQDAPQEAQGALSVAHLAEQAGVSQKDMRRWLRAQARPGRCNPRGARPRARRRRARGRGERLSA
jgi:hypothetical protein